VKKPVCVTLLASFALPLLNGCAWVIHGTHQSIAVASAPSGADVMVQGIKMAQTPGTISVRRGDHITLHFEKEGFKPVDVVLNRDVSGAVFGNILLGGVIGLIVDFSNGAAYKQTPQQVTATLDVLSKTTPTAELKHRSKDTILVIFREKAAGEKAGEPLSVE